jgi:hypothetical protein
MRGGRFRAVQERPLESHVFRVRYAPGHAESRSGRVFRAQVEDRRKIKAFLAAGRLRW